MGIDKATQERGRIGGQRFLHCAVGFITLDAAEMTTAQLIVTQRRIGVLHHVLLSAGLGVGLGLGHISPQRKLGLGRRETGLGMQACVFACSLKRQAQAGSRNDQRTHAVTRDDLDGLVGATRAPQIGAQIAVRLRTQFQALDLVMLAIKVALAGREQLLEHL